MHKIIDLSFKVRWRIRPDEVADTLSTITRDLVQECERDMNAQILCAEVYVDNALTLDLCPKSSTNGWKVLCREAEWITEDQEVARAVVDGLRAFGIRAQLAKHEK